MPRPTDQSGTYRAYNPAWPPSQPAPWRAGRGALLLYTLVILYASLNPFIGWRKPEVFTLFFWPKYITAFDIVLNVLAYAPLGVLCASLFIAFTRRRDQPRPLPWQQENTRALAWRAWLMAVLAAGVLSAAIETAQAFLPSRVCSPVDWLSNVFGALLGATFMVAHPGRVLLEKVERWRYRHFASGNWIDWGLLLLGLWLFAQLNPAIPFFEAGNVVNQLVSGEKPHPYDPLYLLPQAVGIALNVCGFVLFITVLLHPAKRVWANVWVVLLLGLVAKVSMASLMLKAPLMIAWMGPGTVIGLTSGLLLAILFSGVKYHWRVFGATLFVFAGGVMAKISSVYNAFDETLRLFDWPYGQLVNFASLTHWVSEIWPLLAFLFLAMVFVKHRRGD